MNFSLLTCRPTTRAAAAAERNQWRCTPRALSSGAYGLRSLPKGCGYFVFSKAHDIAIILRLSKELRDLIFVSVTALPDIPAAKRKHFRFKSLII